MFLIASSVFSLRFFPYSSKSIGRGKISSSSSADSGSISFFLLLFPILGTPYVLIEDDSDADAAPGPNATCTEAADMDIKIEEKVMQQS